MEALIQSAGASLTLLAVVQATSLSFVLYAVSVLLSKRIDATLAPLAAISIIPIAAMACFWLTFFVPISALYISLVYWLAVAASCLFSLKQDIQRDAAIEAALWWVSVVGLLLWGFGSTGTDQMIELARVRWSHPLPGDNELPLVFAKALFGGQIPSPFYGDWLSSDRPPLQTGLYILTRIPCIEINTSYQIAAVAAQLLIVPASYLLAMALRADRITAAITTVVVFFAPFTLVNGIFVWPKLLTAALLCAAAAIHFTPLYSKLKGSLLAGVAVGASTAGGLLSHGAGAFTVLGFLAAAILTARLASLRYSVAAILSACILFIPWTAYQKFYDPPGDRLVKWHLAGVEDAKDDRTAWNAIKDVYSDLTIAQWLNNAGDKIRFTAAAPAQAFDYTSPAEDVRGKMFFHPIPAMGFVGILSVLAVLAGVFHSTFRPIAIGIIVNYLVWVGLEYKTVGVVVHQSSLYMLVIPMIMLIVMLGRQRILTALLASGQIATAAYYFAY